MKILHLISSGGLYGAETMVVALSRCLQQRGHTSIVGVFHNLHSPNTQVAEHARSSGVPVELIACKGRLDPSAVMALRRIIRQREIDAVHAHGYKADIYGYAASRGLGTPILSTCHTWYDNDMAAYLYGVLDRRVLKRFNMTIAVSESVAALLRSAGVAETRISIINNGVDLAAFATAEPTLRHELGGNGTIIGTVARLAPEKGIPCLLQAAAVVLKQYPEAVFALVGDGPDRQQLEAEACNLKIEKNVVFTGARRDMAGIYASLDLLVQPSLKEGLPMTILEALAAKRAVVATDVGAVPRVIQNEKTGLLVPSDNSDALANAILRLLNDQMLRQKLAQGGHQLVRDSFSAEVMAHAYLQLYESVIRRTNGHHA